MQLNSLVRESLCNMVPVVSTSSGRQARQPQVYNSRTERKAVWWLLQVSLYWICHLLQGREKVYIYFWSLAGKVCTAKCGCDLPFPLACSWFLRFIALLPVNTFMVLALFVLQTSVCSSCQRILWLRLGGLQKLSSLRRTGLRSLRVTLVKVH